MPFVRFILMALVAAIPMIGMGILRGLEHVRIKPVISAAPSIIESGAHALKPQDIPITVRPKETGIGLNLDSVTAKTNIKAAIANTSQSDQQWSDILKLAKANVRSSKNALSSNFASLDNRRIEGGILQLASIPSDRDQFNQIFGKFPDNEVAANTTATAKRFVEEGALDIPTSLGNFEATSLTRASS